MMSLLPLVVVLILVACIVQRPRGHRHSLLYAVYMRSPLWRLRRRIWILHARGRCEACGRRRRPLSIHHRTYARLGHERRNDIQVLCWPCHRRRDQKGAPDRRSPVRPQLRRPR
jgi:hypothetical protein